MSIFPIGKEYKDDIDKAMESEYSDENSIETMSILVKGYK